MTLLHEATQPTSNGFSLIKNPFVIWPTIGGLIVFAEYWPLTRYGFLFPRVMFEVIFVISILLIPISLVGVFPSKTSKASFRVLATCFIFLVVYMISLNIGRHARYHAFAAFAERSKPLIAAIESYETKYGEPPASLQSLIPEFLEKPPTTGMLAYPHYYYARNMQGHRWMLRVSVGSIFDWTTILYWPSQDYCDSWIRFGDWGYVPD